MADVIVQAAVAVAVLLVVASALVLPDVWAWRTRFRSWPWWEDERHG